MVRVLSDGDVDALIDLVDLLPVVEGAFVKQGRGKVERPERPHFPIGTGLDSADPGTPMGTGLAMPAYLHGADHYATKLVSVHEDNPERGLPAVNAQIALVEAATGLPAAFMAGTRITNARTGCIGGSAARRLADEPVRLGIVGAGTQARWQARAIDAVTEIESIRIYSPSDSKHACADDLATELDVPAEATTSARETVAGSTVVVTATTATAPVFPGEALEPGTLVIAIGAYTEGMRELDATTMERAATVYADVPAEVTEIGDVLESDLASDDLVAFSSVVSEGTTHDPDDVIVVESVGSAVLDAAAAEHVFETARERGVGVTVEL